MGDLAGGRVELAVQGVQLVVALAMRRIGLAAVIGAVPGRGVGAVGEARGEHRPAVGGADGAHRDLLGQARQVKVNKENTTIVDGAGSKEEIENRTAQIQAQIAETTSDYDREKLQERLAKLSGGVAVIQVGAATEIEMKERKLRIEDALAATRAATEEGIVPGGGIALLNAIPYVKAIEGKYAGDAKTGVQIILRAMEEPMRQIALNAGIDGAVIIENIRRSRKTGYGFDALKNEYVDMIDRGIIDPTKVARSALQNASSVAAMVLTTESIVTDIPAPEPAPAAPAGGMGGMY